MMKKCAKEGQMEAVRTMAKDIVRMKQTRTRFIKLKAELRSLSAEMESMSATHSMQAAMKNVSVAMQKCSKFISLPDLQKAIQKYQIESEKMSMKQEMVSDAMDDAFEDAEDEEDELLAKVMDEVGLDLDGKLADAPEQKKEVEKGQEEENDDLQ